MMKGYECEQCHYKSINKSSFCPKCGERSMAAIDVPKEGVIFSYTTIHASPEEFRHLAPYHVALVELEEGLKVTVLLEGRVTIGDKVKLREVKDKRFIFTLA